MSRGYRSSEVLNKTDLKASKSFDKLLAGHLVRATEITKRHEFYGIVVSFDKIKKELGKVKKDDKSWENCIWAVWSTSIESAIKNYENVDEEKFVPNSFAGELKYLSPRNWEFEILDLEDNLKEIYSEIYDNK
jgi:hypothetical protein